VRTVNTATQTALDETHFILSRTSLGLSTLSYNLMQECVNDSTGSLYGSLRLSLHRPPDLQMVHISALVLPT
jgi:hypothetical protein